MSHVGGRYDDDTRTVIVQHLGQFMTHEFTHALHAADQHAVGQEHAVWVSEGLASLYESAEVVDEKPSAPRKLAAARGAAAAPAPYADPAGYASEDERGKRSEHAPDLAYGESSGLLLYLDERDLLRKFYDAYKESWPSDSSGKQALEKITGLSLPDLQKAWTEWLLNAPETRPAVRPNGPMLGVRLAEAVDGLAINEIIPGGPAAKCRCGLTMSSSPSTARRRATRTPSTG